MFRRTLAAAALLVLVSTAAIAAPPRDAAEIELALKKLTVVGSALYVGAHPDDENTAMIAWLSCAPRICR